MSYNCGEHQYLLDKLDDVSEAMIGRGDMDFGEYAVFDLLHVVIAAIKEPDGLVFDSPYKTFVALQARFGKDFLERTDASVEEHYAQFTELPYPTAKDA